MEGQPQQINAVGTADGIGIFGWLCPFPFNDLRASLIIEWE
jgi:hypothetical protein